MRDNRKIRGRLKMRGEGNTVKGENLRSRLGYTLRRNCHKVL